MNLNEEEEHLELLPLNHPFNKIRIKKKAPTQVSTPISRNNIAHSINFQYVNKIIQFE